MCGQILYHYCSVDTFVKIIKSAKLRLMDIKKSNDYQECILCRDKIIEKIEDILMEDKDRLEAWQAGRSICAQETVKYCACFSEHRDMLSQWRGYASQGSGIAIGFDKKYLLEIGKADKYRMHFAKVIYCKKDHEKIINQIIDDMSRRSEQKGIFHVAVELEQNWGMQFPFLKNEGFYEEAEWRLVAVGATEPYNPISSENISTSRIKIDVFGSKIKTYLEMDFSRVKSDFIKEIVIGPRSEVTIEDVEKLFLLEGYYNNVLGNGGYNKDEPIRICHSETSYR